MAQGPQSTTSSASDHLAKVVTCIFLVLLVVVGIWFLHRQWYITPIFWFRHYEIIVIQFLLEKWAFVANVLHLPSVGAHYRHAVREMDHYILSAEPQAVDFASFVQANQFVGNWTRFPVMLILTILAAYLYFAHSEARFKNIYTMYKLRKEGSYNWPQITPILSQDLVKQNLDEGPWAMAQMPMNFCQQHQLLRVGEREGKKIWTIKTQSAYPIFALQLGPLWTGIRALPIETKALAVIFIARALRDRELADRFLLQIARSAASSGQLNFSGIEKQAERYADAKPLKWLEKRHAYVSTLMASLLELARIDGVLASAEFLWLKPVNRRLWYTLNTIGRMTAVVEVSGIYAHWLVEKRLNQAVKTPMVKEAVVALQQAIEDSLFIEEGERWHIEPTNHAA